MNTIARAWAAGFFDGEGCSTLSDRYLYLQVKQVDEYGIRRFHAAVDGLGKITGPHASRVETRAPIFVWRAGGKEAMDAMAILWPFLGPAKQEQYNRCFAIWDQTRHGGGHCRRGHPLTGDNLYIHPTDGSRLCRTCKSLMNKALHERKKAAACA